MTRRSLVLIAVLAVVPALQVPAAQSSARLPARLSAPELASLITELSEPDGFFRSDNLVSNELYMQRVIPDLTRLVRPGRAYLGVGPEQNFTYIAAIKPAMVFIIDVRRGNLQLHLMYKAIFELSADRADFVSRLFSLKRPSGLTRKSTAAEIFAAYADPKLRSPEIYKQNLAAIRRLLSAKTGMAVAESDLAGIEDRYSTFFTRGLDVHYEITPGSPGSFPTYSELMTATDGAGVTRSYLASEDSFGVIKDMHARNVIVPIVGNFAGPKAIRAVAKYLKARHALVGAFYVSNVEQYLERGGGLDEFCGNAAALPLDDSSTFIRSERGGFAPRAGSGFPPRGGFGGNFSSQLRNILSEVKNCMR